MLCVLCVYVCCVLCVLCVCVLCVCVCCVLCVLCVCCVCVCVFIEEMSSTKRKYSESKKQMRERGGRERLNTSATNSKHKEKH